mmetsp:Transcript_37852/g.57924  ORF Transcript_37852/g.57924 Transcript_37852/m.57924 type:complete len:92 (+) Transcript_37852:188-463(+)
MAKEHNFNLNDPQIIRSFKAIQEQNLRDVRAMKEGRKPMTEDELQDFLKKEQEKEFQERMDKLKEEEKKKELSQSKIQEILKEKQEEEKSK